MKFSILKDVESFNDGFSPQKDTSASLGAFIPLVLENGVSEKIKKLMQYQNESKDKW